jgi:hypothetical protein
MCSTEPFKLKSLIQNDLQSCNNSTKGIHIVPGLYPKSLSQDICDSFGWKLLDIGNFNILTVINLSEACNIQFGWVRSVHGYYNPYGTIYFVQGPPVLGAAVGILEQGILAPVYCQEQDEQPTSLATFSISRVITLDETTTEIDTLTSTAFVTYTRVEPILNVDQ